MAYNNQGQFTVAISDYDKAIEMDPRYAAAYINRAVVYYELGQYDKAWGDVHKAEELGAIVNPGFVSALKKVWGIMPLLPKNNFNYLNICIFIVLLLYGFALYFYPLQSKTFYFDDRFSIENNEAVKTIDIPRILMPLTPGF